jgi:hypothetical protein
MKGTMYKGVFFPDLGPEGEHQGEKIEVMDISRSREKEAKPVKKARSGWFKEILIRVFK